MLLRRTALKAIATIASTAALGVTVTGCESPTKATQRAALVVADFLMAGYDKKTSQDYNLIRGAAEADIKDIFVGTFPYLAKFVWLEGSDPKYILGAVKYFYAIQTLAEGAILRSEVDATKLVLGKDGIIKVPNGALALYIDNVADNPSSSPDETAYELHKPDGDWLIKLYF